MKQRALHFVLCLLLMVLTACKDVAIVHDLTEREANRISVLLARYHIESTPEKVKENQEVTWMVSVKDKDEAAARSILDANNLPKVKHGGLSGICKTPPLIVSPETEKCQKILAYKEEIINSLESIPGVVSADVVLNLPDAQEFPDPNTPSPHATASVTVQQIKEADGAMSLTENKIQEFVSNSVSGLDERDVAVILTLIDTGAPKGADNIKTSDNTNKQTTTTTSINTTTQNQAQVVVSGDDATAPDLMSVGGLKMDENSAKRFKVVAVLFLVLFLMLTVAFIFVLLRMARLKKQASIQASDASGDDGADQKLLGT